jgi:hypothetical protein
MAICVPSAHHVPWPVPSIFPSTDQENTTALIPAAHSTGGSLPDLSNIHFPSPLPTPLDPEEPAFPALSSSGSAGNLATNLTHLGLGAGQGKALRARAPCPHPSARGDLSQLRPKCWERGLGRGRVDRHAVPRRWDGDFRGGQGAGSRLCRVSPARWCSCPCPCWRLSWGSVEDWQCPLNSSVPPYTWHRCVLAAAMRTRPPFPVLSAYLPHPSSAWEPS